MDFNTHEKKKVKKSLNYDSNNNKIPEIFLHLLSKQIISHRINCVGFVGEKILNVQLINEERENFSLNFAIVGEKKHMIMKS